MTTIGIYLSYTPQYYWSRDDSIAISRWLSRLPDILATMSPPLHPAIALSFESKGRNLVDTLVETCPGKPVCRRCTDKTSLSGPSRIISSIQCARARLSLQLANVLRCRSHNDCSRVIPATILQVQGKPLLFSSLVALALHTRRQRRFW